MDPVEIKHIQVSETNYDSQHQCSNEFRPESSPAEEQMKKGFHDSRQTSRMIAVVDKWNSFLTQAIVEPTVAHMHPPT